MSIPFTRSTRSLRNDSFRTSTVILAVALFLLVVWFVWFSLTYVTVYERSQSAWIIDGTRATATFMPAVLGRIDVGQPAQLRIDGFPWSQYGVVAATVTQIHLESATGYVRVEFALQSESAPSIPLQAGMTGTAEVAVGRMTPATLVLRAAGKRVSSQSQSDTTQSQAGVPGVR